jgi:cyclophilin family peptidyl-prolyl cis-trans isomerase
VINLLGDSSPYAVTNFIQQAKGNIYKDRTFYKIINDTQSKDGIQVVLAGNENGSEASYTVRADQNTLEFDRKGLVGMADSTNFFITLAPQKKLTGSYVVFGEVTSGMKIVEEMTQPGLVIQNITITEK